MAGVEYCQEHVTAAVSDGLIALVKAQPDDPVDFLGNFMLHYAKSLESSKAAAEAQAQEAAAAAAAAEAAAAAAAEAAQSPAARAAAEAEALQARLQASLAECSEVTPEVLTALLEGLAQLTGAAGAYLAERLGEPAPEGEEPGKACVRYVAASASSAGVLGARLAEGQGVLWPAWVLPPAPEAAEEEEEAEEGAPAKAPPPPPQLPTVHVRQVLKDKRLVHHGIPRPGAFFAQPLQYGSPLHAGAVPPAGEEGGSGGAGEEGEEEEPPLGEGEEEPSEEAKAARAAARAEAAAAARAAAAAAGPSPVTVPRSLALCLDTCGQNRDFTPAQLALVRAASGWLQAALERTERARFKEEYFAMLKPKDAAEEEAIRNEERAAAEAVAKAGDEAEAAAGEAAAEDLKRLARANACLAAARSALGAREAAFHALASRRVPPQEPTLKVLQALLLTLGRSQESMADATAADPAAFDWPTARRCLDASVLAAVGEGGYDPAAPPPARVLAYARTDAIRALLEGLEPGEELAVKEGAVVAACAAWVRAALDIREASAARRQREKEEAEAKAAADKEAAEAAAAAAAEAAEAAAEGGGEEEAAE